MCYNIVHIGVKFMEKLKKSKMKEYTNTEKSKEEKLREDYDKDRFRRYFDNGSTLEDLKNDIKKLEKEKGIQIITKAEWKLVEAVYNESCKPKRTERVKKIVGEEDLREILRSSSLEEYEALISNSNFDNMTDEEILDAVLNLTSTNSNVNSNLKNLIVFPTDTFVEKQKNRIMNSRAGINPDKEIKTISNQLEAIKSSTTKFIELVCNGRPYAFDGSSKAYVYGNVNARVCFLNVYVNESNREELQSVYPQFTKVLCAFGLSITNMEKDTELYGNAIRYLNSIRNEFYTNVYSIFAYPFTEETRKQAFDLIDNSMAQLEEFAGGEVDPDSKVKDGNTKKRGKK